MKLSDISTITEQLIISSDYNIIEDKLMQLAKKGGYYESDQQRNMLTKYIHNNRVVINHYLKLAKTNKDTDDKITTVFDFDENGIIQIEKLRGAHSVLLFRRKNIK